MGYNTAQDLAGLDIKLEDSIRYHLTGNFYPSIPTSMVAPCVKAIELYNMGDTHGLVELPLPIRYRGESTCPAYKLIEAHHLEAWLYEAEDCDDWEDEEDE
jgi:hypothetical protein